MASSSQARNSLYPTDSMMGPTKRPMMPIAKNPPIAPRKTTRMGTGRPRPRQQRLQDVVHKGNEDAPNHEGHRLSRTRSGKDINHEGDQCRASNLKHSGNEEHQCPQARSWESHHEKTQTGKQRLNYRHTQDARGNAANGGPGERFKLLGPVAEKSNCKPSRSSRTLARVREQQSRNHNRDEKLQHANADCRSSRE